MSDFGFIGPAYEAASITQDDQALVNWYVEPDPTKADIPTTQANEAQRGYMALYPCPGLVSRVLPKVGEVRALYTLPGSTLILAVVGNTLYSITTAYVATSRGTLSSSTGPVSITDNGVSAYICDGSNRYYYTWGTTTFATVADGAFTGGNVTDIIDNFMIYNRPGTTQWGCTDAGAVTSNALNLGSIVGASCNIVDVVADHRQVFVIGENYSERHADVGTFPWPFAVIPGSSMQHGCGAKFSIARLAEGVAMLARDKRGNATVIIWGASIAPTRISTYAVETAIQGYAVTSDAIGYTYTMSGHEFYVLTFPTADVTWCYDISTQLWHKRAWRDANGVLHRHRSNCCAVFGDDILVGDYKNGNIYAFSQSTYTDNGDVIPCIRRCRHLTTDLTWQYFSDLQIQFQPGVGLSTGQGSDPECILRWSNDGGFTWGNDHILKLGKIGEYKRRAMKRRLGRGRDRVFEIVVTDPVYRVVVSANMNATSGAN